MNGVYTFLRTIRPIKGSWYADVFVYSCQRSFVERQRSFVERQRSFVERYSWTALPGYEFPNPP
jgi:hypothetical protein